MRSPTARQRGAARSGLEPPTCLPERTALRHCADAPRRDAPRRDALRLTDRTPRRSSPTWRLPRTITTRRSQSRQTRRDGCRGRPLRRSRPTSRHRRRRWIRQSSCSCSCSSSRCAPAAAADCACLRGHALTRPYCRAARRRARPPTSLALSATSTPGTAGAQLRARQARRMRADAAVQQAIPLHVTAPNGHV